MPVGKIVNLDPIDLGPENPTLVQRLLSPLEVLDRPGNAIRSIIRGVRDQKLSDILNVIPSLIPFVDYKKIPISDITGSQNILPNLAAGIVLDPLTYVGGIGTLSKVGKATRRITQLSERVGTLRKIGKTVDALAEEKVLRKLIKENPKSRALVKFPRSQDVLNLARKKPVKAERTLISLNIPFTKPTLEIGNTDFIQRKVAETFKLIPSSIKEPVTEFGKLFSTKLRNPQIQTLKQVRQTDEARRLRTVGTQRVNVLLNRLNQLQEVSGLAKDAFNARILAGIESKVAKQFEGAVNVQQAIDANVNIFFEAQKKKILNKFVRASVKKGADVEKLKLKMFEGIQAAKKLTFVREHKLKEAVDIWGKLSPEETGLILDIHSQAQERLATMMNLGVKDLTPLMSSNDVLSFFHRMPTKEALKLKRKNPKLYNLIQNQTRVNLRNFKRRRLHTMDRIGDLNKLYRKEHGINFDFFNEDIGEVLLKQEQIFAETVTKAEMTHNAIRLFKEEGYKKGITAKGVFNTFGLDPKKIPERLRDVKIPKSVVEDMKGINKLLSTVNDETKFIAQTLAWIDRNINSVFRTAVTAFPAKFNRDFIGNVWNAHVGGVNKLFFKDMSDAFSLYRKVHRRGGISTLTAAEAEKWAMYQRFRIIDVGSDRTEISSVFNLLDNGKPPKFFDQPITATLAKLGKAPNPKKKFDVLLGRGYNRAIDETSKIAMFENKLRQGFSPFEAMNETQKYLFDYSDLSLAEKKFLRPLFLFYTWNRKNMPLALSTLMTKPRLVQAYRHVTQQTTGDERPIPDWLRGGFAFQLDKDTFISRLGLPIDDLILNLNVADADPFISSQLKRLGQRFASNLSPVFKLATESITGEQSFTGRPLKDIPLLDVTRNRIPTGRIISLSPTSRLSRTIDKLFDDKTGAIEKILDLMTGVRTYSNISKQSAEIDTLRRRLLRAGKVREFKVLSPKDKEDKATKETIKVRSRLLKELTNA